MKFIFTIITSVVAVLISSGILFFRNSLGNTLTLTGVAYVLIPIILALSITIRYYPKRNFLLYLVIGLLIYGILMTALEPIIYKVWIVYQIPDGGTYTRYGLDAFYPVVGTFILAIVLIINMIFVLIWTLINKLIIGFRIKGGKPKNVL
jgi:hypothetical protein